MSLADGTPAALSCLSAATIYLLWLEAEGHGSCQMLGLLAVKAQGSKPPAGVSREEWFCLLKGLEWSLCLLATTVISALLSPLLGSVLTPCLLPDHLGTVRWVMGLPWISLLESPLCPHTCAGPSDHLGVTVRSGSIA